MAGGIKEEFKLEDKHELLKLSEVSLWLDNYNDIFSSFDSRQYSERALSDDFLIEAKKASRDKGEDEIELKLLMPNDKRNIRDEAMIKKRLRDHFGHHHTDLEKEQRSIRKMGYLMIGIGVLFMIGATYLINLQEKNFLMNLLIILFEPGGWFTFWTGLDQLFYEQKKKSADLKFYEKMSRCSISFFSY